MLVTPRDRELAKEVAQQLRYIQAAEKISHSEIASLAKICKSSSMNVINKGKGGLMQNVLRIIDALGYEIIFVKKKDRLALGDVPDAVRLHREKLAKEARWKSEQRKRDKMLAAKEKPKNTENFLDDE